MPLWRFSLGERPHAAHSQHAVSSHQRIAQLSVADSTAVGGERQGDDEQPQLQPDKKQAEQKETSVDGKCHVDKHNEYHGDVVMWGDKNMQVRMKYEHMLLAWAVHAGRMSLTAQQHVCSLVIPSHPVCTAWGHAGMHAHWCIG